MKPWYQSKTIWLAILKLAGSIGLYVYGLAMNDVQIQHIAQAAFLLALGDFGLRLATTEPIN